MDVGGEGMFYLIEHGLKFKTFNVSVFDQVFKMLETLFNKIFKKNTNHALPHFGCVLRSNFGMLIVLCKRN